MLGGSTADYGASAQKKKYNYIIKYFTHDCKEEIPKNNIYRIDSLRRGDIDYLIQISNTQRNKNISEDEILKEYKYERRYFYIKDQNGKYKIDSEIEGDYRNIAIIAIRQCFDDGYCKTYEYADGKTYYVLKKYLTPFEDDKIIAIRQCFDGGYCEIYEDYNGKIHYVIKNTQNIVK
ncbi:hypothetical protein CSPB12327_08575 [Campylobacter sp. RM12327]|uniref:hypothetical protein n=1 Tax=Campylobacter sputorum TaxID=206 RepID=UPI0018967B18|nr:hypothetical protein [Campylobacter sp. RM12327]MBF6670186.1 hypothetical protein [Campylobacter sp. RM12327]